MTLVVLGLLVPWVPAEAATFTWDGNGGGGASTNWSNANNWNPNTAPTAGTLTDYVFGSAFKNTNSADGATTWEVNSITFNNTSGAFVISGTAFNLQAGGITNNDTQLQTVNNAMTLKATATINAASGSITLGGIISGTGFGLTKTGGSTLTLNAANTYTGLTTVSAGTLAFGVANALSSGNVTVSGGTLAIGNFSDTVGTVSLTSGSITGGTGVLTGTSYDMQSGTVSAILGGSGVALTKSTAGTVTLNAANTYTGLTTISAGTLAYGVANALSSGNVTVSGGTLAIGNFSDTVGTVSLTSGSITGGTGVLTGTSYDMQSGTVSAILGGSGVALTKSTAGTVTLSAANTYTGLTTVSAGTLAYGVSDALASGNVTVSGGTLALGNFSDTVGTVSLTGGSITGGAGVLTGTSYDMQSGTVSAILGGTGALTKSTTGTVILSGANTYTGTTTVSQGTLQLNASAPSGAAGALGNTTSAVVINDGSTGANNTALLIGASGVTVDRAITVANSGTGTTTIGGNFASGNATFTGNLTLNRSASLNADGTSVIEFNTGTMSGAGAITKTGTGTVLINEANSAAGTTTVNAGTLAVDGNQVNNRLANSAAVVVNNSGTFEIRGVNALSSGSPASFTVNTGGTLNIVSGASTNGGSTSHAHLGNLTLAGGTLNLSYSGSGTAYDNESAQLDGSITATANSTIQFGSGATAANAGLGLNGSTALIVNPGVTLSVSAELEDRDSGASGFTKTGTGTLTLSGTNSYTGVTTINAGTVSVGTIGNGGVAGNLGQATNAATNLVLGGGTLQYTGATASTDRAFTLTNATTSTIDVSSAATNLTMSGSSATTSGGLTKTGAGTLTLSGTNTYTGATSVSAGTLLASGANALGDTSGNITVSAGATLALDGGTNVVRSGLLTLNGSGVSSSFGALAAEGTTGTTSQWTGSTTINTASTISAADNLLIIGNGATAQFNTTTMTLNANVTFNTTAAATVLPTYLPAPAYVLDAANIVVNSQITGTGGIIKTGTGTLSLIRGTSTDNTFTGTTSVLGGKLIVDGPSNHTPLSSTNIFVGNLGSGSNDTVTLQMGELATASGNNIIGTYNAATDASNSNLTIYEDGVFKMNRGNNGFINLTLSGGHVDSGGNNALLTLSGGLTTLASAQTSLIENGNLGIGSNKLTVSSAAGTTLSGIDLQIDSKIQQGALFASVASGTALEKTGTGKVVLTGANTYGGVTDVLAGVLNIQNNTALGQDNTGYAFNSTNNGTTVSSGAQLQVQGGITVAKETLTLAGTGVSSTGALRNISGNNTLNSYVYLSADTRINSDAGTLTIANPSGVNSGVLDGTAAGKNLTVGGAGNTTINGAIGGSVAGITKDGTGTLTLAGNDAYSGATAVTAGILKVTHSNGLAGTGVTVSNNAALQFAQDAANANIAEVGIAANITGTGISNGGAIENLNGNNSYAGNVTLAGNSRITSDASSSLTMSGSVTGAGFALSVGGAGDTTYNGVISGTGTTLTKTDTGTVTLGGTTANTYTGTTSINDGTLALNKTAGVNAIASSTVTIGDGSGAAGSASLLLSQSNQIIDSAAVSLGSDGKLNLNSKNETVGSIAGSGQILFGTGQLVEGGSNASTTFSGTLAGSAGSSLTKNGSGTLTISSNVNATPGDFAGDLNLNTGGLTLSASNAFTGTLNVAAGTTLTLSNANISVANLNFTGTGTVTLDFGGSSTLNVLNNLTLSAGVTINIINWTNAVDYWYAANWSGAVLDLRGVTPMNQIIFDSPTWVGNNTIWQGYDHQITPVPEPSTYGALLLGAMGALLGYRRHRQAKAAAKK